MPHRWQILVGVAALASGSCARGKSTPPPARQGQACTAGAVATCMCSPGEAGLRTCGVEGTFGPCDCLPSAGAVCPGGGTACFEWSQWPMPPDSPPSSEFEANTDGTVTDTLTGLTWFAAVFNKGCPTDGSQGTCTLADAEQICASIGVGGSSVVARLPTMIELLSIVDCGQSQPSINSLFFPETLPSPEWTSTPDPVVPGNFLTVDFHAGFVISESPTSEGAWVRCVKASMTSASGPPARYSYPDGTAAMSDTVLDTVTGLTWQRAVPSNPCPADEVAGVGQCTWEHAEAYCSSLSLAGLDSGWRLPAYKELLSLVVPKEAFPSIDGTAFPNTPDGAYFWASTEFPPPNSTGHYSLDFSYIGDMPTQIPTFMTVRCVR